MDIKRGEVRPRSSGEAEPSPYPLGVTEPTPRGSGEAECIPQPSGEAETALGRGRAGPKASGETEASPLPSGEAGLVQRRRARRNLSFVIRARNAAALLSIQKFLTFDGYWFHLLGYPGIRSPTVAPEPPGDSSRTAWRVFFDFVEVTLPEGAHERTRWV